MREVEVTVQYATRAETLLEAWNFVMSHVDKVGTNPTIHIEPVFVNREDGFHRHFAVVVSGMVEKEQT